MLKRVFVLGRYELALAPLVLLVPDVAHAQCTSAPSPQPTIPDTINYNGQTFDENTPFNSQNNGQVGCNGQSHDYNHNGDPGSPGQPAGSLTNVATNVTIYGWPGATISSTGGNGGNGGNAGNPVSKDLSGGTGGSGGGGGAATINFLGTIRPSGAGGLAQLGLQIGSFGGSGGQGGASGLVVKETRTAETVVAVVRGHWPSLRVAAKCRLPSQL